MIKNIYKKHKTHKKNCEKRLVVGIVRASFINFSKNSGYKINLFYGKSRFTWDRNSLF